MKEENEKLVVTDVVRSPQEKDALIEQASRYMSHDDAVALVNQPVVTDVDPETHEATVESNEEGRCIFTAKLKAPPPKPGWREYKKSEEHFIKSVRSLLDHMRSEPKHAALLVLLNDCEREYRNLSSTLHCWCCSTIANASTETSWRGHE